MIQETHQSKDLFIFYKQQQKIRESDSYIKNKVKNTELSVRDKGSVRKKKLIYQKLKTEEARSSNISHSASKYDLNLISLSKKLELYPANGPNKQKKNQSESRLIINIQTQPNEKGERQVIENSASSNNQILPPYYIKDKEDPEQTNTLENSKPFEKQQRSRSIQISDEDSDKRQFRMLNKFKNKQTTKEDLIANFNNSFIIKAIKKTPLKLPLLLHFQEKLINKQVLHGKQKFLSGKAKPLLANNKFIKKPQIGEGSLTQIKKTKFNREEHNEQQKRKLSADKRNIQKNVPKSYQSIIGSKILQKQSLSIQSFINLVGEVSEQRPAAWIERKKALMKRFGLNFDYNK